MNDVVVDPRVRDSAIRWLVRAHSGQMSNRERQALQQWREASVDHEYAWQRVNSLSLNGHPSVSLLTDATARQALQEAGVNPQHPRRQALKYLLTLGLLGGLSWQASESTPVRSAFARYRTAVGERRHWALADGSSLWLNTASAVDLEMSTERRTVELIEGELALDFPNRSTLLQLHTQDAVLYSHSANLLVRHDYQRTQVAVLRGEVLINTHYQPTPFPLAAGWQMQFGNRLAGTVTPVDTSLAEAWIRGVLPAERMRLDQLLAELSRYRPGLLNCSDSVAALRITGSFRLDNTDAALALIAASLPVRIERKTRYWVTVVPV